MQKKLIALAVAAVTAAPAFAQSNVTVYGRLDVLYEHTGASGGQKSNAIESGGLGGSMLGFMGEESLGGGMKAVFKLEMDTNADGNTSAGGINNMTSTRNVYVGLTGGFGTVVAGRLNSPGMDASLKYDNMGGSSFSPVASLSRAGGGRFNVSTIDASGRLNNAVAYVSPNFGGLTATVAHAFAGATGEVVTSGTAANAKQEAVTGIRLDFSNGPLDVGFTHHRINDLGNTLVNAASVKARENHLGVNYNFGMAKVHASYQTGKTNVVNVGTDKIWNIGVTVPMGNGNIRVAYAKLNDNDVATQNDDASGFGLQYDYMLSKRTTVYGGYQRVSNKGVGVIQTSMGGAVPTAGGNSTGYGLGIRHTF